MSRFWRPGWCHGGAVGPGARSGAGGRAPARAPAGGHGTRALAWRFGPVSVSRAGARAGVKARPTRGAQLPKNSLLPSMPCLIWASENGCITQKLNPRPGHDKHKAYRQPAPAPAGPAAGPQGLVGRRLGADQRTPKKALRTPPPGLPRLPGLASTACRPGQCPARTPRASSAAAGPAQITHPGGASAGQTGHLKKGAAPHKGPRRETCAS